MTSHAVREGDAVGNLAHGAVGADEGDDAGANGSPAIVEAAAVDVCVAAPVDDELVAGGWHRGLSQVPVSDNRAVLLTPPKQALSGGHKEQAAVWKPIHAERE